MTQRLKKYWKADFMPGSNKTFLQSGNVNFSCPVRAIKRKDMNQGCEVKYCFPLSSKRQTESLGQMKKRPWSRKAQCYTLPTCFLQFVVRNRSYQKFSGALPVVAGEDLLMRK